MAYNQYSTKPLFQTATLRNSLPIAGAYVPSYYQSPKPVPKKTIKQILFSASREGQFGTRLSLRKQARRIKRGLSLTDKTTYLFCVSPFHELFPGNQRAARLRRQRQQAKKERAATAYGQIGGRRKLRHEQERLDRPLVKQDKKKTYMYSVSPWDADYPGYVKNQTTAEQIRAQRARPVKSYYTASPFSGEWNELVANANRKTIEEQAKKKVGTKKQKRAFDSDKPDFVTHSPWSDDFERACNAVRLGQNREFSASIRRANQKRQHQQKPKVHSAFAVFKAYSPWSDLFEASTSAEDSVSRPKARKTPKRKNKPVSSAHKGIQKGIEGQKHRFEPSARLPAGYEAAGSSPIHAPFPRITPLARTAQPASFGPLSSSSSRSFEQYGPAPVMNGSLGWQLLG